MPRTITPRRAQGAARDQLVQVNDLTGGIDRRTSPTLLKPDRARKLMNSRLSVVGRWIPRPGWEQFSTTSLGNDRPNGGQRIYLSDTDPFTLFGYQGDLYKTTDAGVFGSSVLSGLDNANPYCFPFDAEIVAVFDGITQPQKSQDGTTWTQLGITAPSAAPVVTAVAGGSLIDTNQYGFSYTYQNDALGDESNESAEGTVSMATPNLTAQVAVIASADPQVTSINIYARNITAGETVRRYVGNYANTTTNRNITSESWTTESLEAPTTNDVPPPLAFGVIWKNRWWAHDPETPTRIRFSELFQNQSWPTNYYIDMPFTQGDVVTAIIPLGDTLIVLGSGRLGFLIFGQSSLDFDVRPSAQTQAGCFGFRAWDLMEGGILRAAAEGVYIFDGATDRLVSYDFEGDWRDMASSNTNDDLTRIAVVYHQRDKEARISVPELPLYGTPGEWVLDLARTKVSNIPAWSNTDREIGGYMSWNGPETTTGNRGKLMTWALTGIMCQESTGTTADGSDLNAEYEGPSFPTGMYVARVMNLFTEYSSASGTLGATVRVDGQEVFSGNVDIGSGLSVIGTATIGSSTIGGPDRAMFPIQLPLDAEGRSASVTYTYHGQATPIIYDYAFEIQPEPAIRGIV